MLLIIRIDVPCFQNQEEDWVTIGVVIHKSDPKSSNKSGKLFSIIKLGDLQVTALPLKLC